MKTIRLISAFVLILITSSLYAQSRSFQALKNNFSGQEKVNCFEVDGFLCRIMFSVVGDWEFKQAVHDVRGIRLINIPKGTFGTQQLSVDGFRKYLKNDNFVQMATVRDKGDYIEIYLQENGNKKDRYFVLVEGKRDVTGVEIKGTIDINKLKNMNSELSYRGK